MKIWFFVLGFLLLLMMAGCTRVEKVSFDGPQQVEVINSAPNELLVFELENREIRGKCWLNATEQVNFSMLLVSTNLDSEKRYIEKKDENILIRYPYVWQSDTWRYPYFERINRKDFTSNDCSIVPYQGLTFRAIKYLNSVLVKNTSIRCYFPRGDRFSEITFDYQCGQKSCSSGELENIHTFQINDWLFERCFKQQENI